MNVGITGPTDLNGSSYFVLLSSESHLVLTWPEIAQYERTGICVWRSLEVVVVTCQSASAIFSHGRYSSSAQSAQHMDDHVVRRVLMGASSGST